MLEKDWLTTGIMDFEYKKYVLLAYLKDVKESFDLIKLYPALSDMVFHYQNLMSIKENRQMLLDNFPKSLSQTDFETLQLHYESMVKDDELMLLLEEVILYALPKFKTLLALGKDIYEHIEEHLEINPIGISPLRYDEGYLFLEEAKLREWKIYMYQITFFENANEKFRGIHLVYLESVAKSLSLTLENLKLQLIRQYQSMPNPATYHLHSRISCPLEETLIPVAKRYLVKYLTKQSA